MDKEIPKSNAATLILRGEHITLAHALKAAGLVGSGGQGKYLVREGNVTVNGMAEDRPGRKLAVGDCFRVADGPEWTVSR